MRALTLVAVAVAAALAGCTVGPDFHAPDAPAASRYTAAPQASATAAASGVTQRLVTAPEPRNDWWVLFQSPALDALVAEALAGNPSVAEARARLVQAREQMSAQDAATTWPQVNLDAGIKRQQIDPAALGFPQAPVPPPFTVYNLGLDVSYTLDVFGGTRRQVEAAGAHVDYAAAELDVARRTLAANVVTAALRAATLRSRIATTEALLATQRQQLAIAEQRLALGAVADVDVENQRNLVAQTAAQLPPLAAQLSATEHELAAYVGKAPADATLPAFTLASFTLPAAIPVAVPADLVRQRPDVRASEALLHEASA
ncbi:MAG: efflux transporter outer membrane subunit, partial [Proteobacteria bacterium]|nr:efflux transporter outer membrane subunit [Pseudomonadota bacterium]